MSWTIERKQDHVVVVTMNTNKVNAQGPAFFDDLHGAFDRLDSAFKDCAVVLTAAGATFSAGLDLDHHFAMYARRNLEEIDNWFAAYRAASLRLFTYPRPIVAAINGHAFAGGLITAISCDYRIAADGPLKCALNEVSIGVPMPATFCEILSYAIGTHAAAELTLFSQVLDLPSASRMRIVQKIVAPEQLLDAAVASAAQVSPDCYPAFAYSKSALQATTMSAIGEAGLVDAKQLSRYMSDPKSLKANAQCYRDLKGRDITWSLSD